MSSHAQIQELLIRLRRRYGRANKEGMSNVFSFESGMKWSINFSKLLAGHKYFFGIPKAILDDLPSTDATQSSTFVLLICGSSEQVLVLPVELVRDMLKDVPSRRVDLFVEDGAFILQTTRHPKLNVTSFLNAFPEPAVEIDKQVGEQLPQNPVTRNHVRVQHHLIKLGRAEGCQVWVPAADRGLSFDRQAFTSITIPRLPNFGFDEISRRIICNIDVLWLEGNVIQSAFEIEASTSIYSGLLRLNDLALAQPNNQIQLFLSASNSRRQKVVGQLSRPSFRSLVTSCKFLSFEDVDTAHKQLKRVAIDEHTRVQGLIRGETIQPIVGDFLPVFNE